MLEILFILIQLCFVVYLLFYIIAFVSSAPFVPSTHRAADSMIALARIIKGKKIYDLGSGDGRLLFLAAQKGANAVGYELNPILVILTIIKRLFSQTPGSVMVRWQSLWKADIHNAEVVFVYLMPTSMDKLQQKLLSELRPGTTVISNSFIFKTWPVVDKDSQNHVFVFRVPKPKGQRD
jgi:hypothetical protein